MSNVYVEKMKDLMKNLFEVADNLESKGIGKLIPYIDQDTSFRDVVKMDVQLFLFRLLDQDKQISPSSINYLNECLDCNYGELSLEMMRRKTVSSTTPHICVLLPFFIAIDNQSDRQKVSVAYVQAICCVALGFLESQDRTSLEEMVRYSRYASACLKIIEKNHGIIIDFDPLLFIQEDKKKMIETAVEVYNQLHKPEDDPVIRELEQNVRTIMSKVVSREDRSRNSEDSTSIDEAYVNANDCGNGDDERTEHISAMEELDSLIGLEDVKNQVRTLVNVLQIRKKCRQLNIKRPAITLHMVFTGNPGTGKTTVARILGRVYKETGLLSKGHMVEVGRADLVGKYVGHTAVMVKEVFEKAKGGVLFIDEAYSLTNEDGGGFGQEAVETLLKLMEDNRDDIAVIVAGYPALMYEFLETNPGLRSRFPFIIQFPDYTGAELSRIFRRFCSENDIMPSGKVMSAVKSHFEKEASKKVKNYGNARAVRNYFERMIMNQANRLIRTECYEKDDLCEFISADLPGDNIFHKSMDHHSQFVV